MPMNIFPYFFYPRVMLISDICETVRIKL